jgi:hypothetical protein
MTSPHLGDPALGRFNPLPRILFHDDFDSGLNGWCELIGNHDGDLDRVRPVVADMRPPQLSTLSFFDIGSHGAIDGSYALKLATRPTPGHMALAIKRLTAVRPGPVQFEMWFTFKAEQTFDRRRGRSHDGNQDPSALDFGDFTVSNDVCEGEQGVRYHTCLRYAHTDRHGILLQRWMSKTSVQTTTRMEWSGAAGAAQDYHVAHPDDWAEVPGGRQKLCYNEVPSKVNWHYLRWLFDLRNRRSVELQVSDRTMDLREIPVPTYPDSYWGLERLLNLSLDVRTHTPVRNFLFVDSVLVSVDW